MRDPTLMFHLHRQLPIIFLMRFGAFWFIGIIGAVLLFLLYLRLTRLYMSRTDRLYAVQLSKVILTVVTSGVALSAIALYLLISL